MKVGFLFKVIYEHYEGDDFVFNSFYESNEDTLNDELAIEFILGEMKNQLRINKTDNLTFVGKDYNYFLFENLGTKVSTSQRRCLDYYKVFINNCLETSEGNYKVLDFK